MTCPQSVTIHQDDARWAVDRLRDLMDAWTATETSGSGAWPRFLQLAGAVLDETIDCPERLAAFITTSTVYARVISVATMPGSVEVGMGAWVDLLGERPRALRLVPPSD